MVATGWASGKGAYGSNWMGPTVDTDRCGLQKHVSS